MSIHCTQAHQHQAVIDSARFDEISMTLHNLTEIVKLAAFAAEARRTLAGIDNATFFQPELKEAIPASVFHSAQWTQLKNNTSEVLDYVGRQMQKVNDNLNESFLDLVPPRALISKTKNKGGEI